MQPKAETTFERWVREYENDPEFIADEIAVELVEEALRLLKEGNHTQAWLASSMGVSPSHVSNIFNAPPNLKLISIARLAVALGVKPRVMLDSDRWYITPRTRADGSTIDHEELTTDAAISMARADTTSPNVVAWRGGIPADASS